MLPVELPSLKRGLLQLGSNEIKQTLQVGKPLTPARGRTLERRLPVHLTSACLPQSQQVGEVGWTFFAHLAAGLDLIVLRVLSLIAVAKSLPT